MMKIAPVDDALRVAPDAVAAETITIPLDGGGELETPETTKDDTNLEALSKASSLQGFSKRSKSSKSRNKTTEDEKRKEGRSKRGSSRSRAGAGDDNTGGGERLPPREKSSSSRHSRGLKKTTSSGKDGKKKVIHRSRSLNEMDEATKQAAIASTKGDSAAKNGDKHNLPKRTNSKNKKPIRKSWSLDEKEAYAGVITDADFDLKDSEETKEEEEEESGKPDGESVTGIKLSSEGDDINRETKDEGDTAENEEANKDSLDTGTDSSEKEKQGESDEMKEKETDDEKPEVDQAAAVAAALSAQRRPKVIKKMKPIGAATDQSECEESGDDANDDEKVDDENATEGRQRRTRSSSSKKLSAPKKRHSAPTLVESGDDEDEDRPTRNRRRVRDRERRQATRSPPKRNSAPSLITKRAISRSKSMDGMDAMAGNLRGGQKKDELKSKSTHARTTSLSKKSMKRSTSMGLHLDKNNNKSGGPEGEHGKGIGAQTGPLPRSKVAARRQTLTRKQLQRSLSMSSVSKKEDGTTSGPTSSLLDNLKRKNASASSAKHNPVTEGKKAAGDPLKSRSSHSRLSQKTATTEGERTDGRQRKPIRRMKSMSGLGDMTGAATLPDAPKRRSGQGKSGHTRSSHSRLGTAAVGGDAGALELAENAPKQSGQGRSLHKRSDGRSRRSRTDLLRETEAVTSGAETKLRDGNRRKVSPKNGASQRQRRTSVAVSPGREGNTAGAKKTRDKHRRNPSPKRKSVSVSPTRNRKPKDDTLADDNNDDSEEDKKPKDLGNKTGQRRSNGRRRMSSAMPSYMLGNFQLQQALHNSTYLDDDGDEEDDEVVKRKAKRVNSAGSSKRTGQARRASAAHGNDPLRQTNSSHERRSVGSGAVSGFFPNFPTFEERRAQRRDSGVADDSAVNQTPSRSSGSGIAISSFVSMRMRRSVSGTKDDLGASVQNAASKPRLSITDLFSSTDNTDDQADGQAPTLMQQVASMFPDRERASSTQSSTPASSWTGLLTGQITPSEGPKPSLGPGNSGATHGATHGDEKTAERLRQLGLNLSKTTASASGGATTANRNRNSFVMPMINKKGNSDHKPKGGGSTTAAAISSFSLRSKVSSYGKFDDLNDLDDLNGASDDDGFAI